MHLPTATSAGSRSRARSPTRAALLLLDEPAAGMNPAESARAGRADPAHPRTSGSRSPGRARHEGRHAGLRAHRGAGLRREDRRGHAGRRSARSRRDRGLSRAPASGTSRTADGAGRAVAPARRTSRAATAGSTPCAVSLGRRGEIVALLGANGAGKITTLRALSGLFRPRRGRSCFDGAGIVARCARPRSSGAGIVQCPEGRRVFPRHARYSRTSALGRLPRRARPRRRRTLERVFTLFPSLRERRTQLGGTLSGGEQQMLAIARALMARAALLLLDEPSLGLAPLLVQQIFQTIAEINRQGPSCCWSSRTRTSR